MHEGNGLLIDFEEIASLKALANQYGDQLKYVSGPAKEQLGLNAVLIRPDGIVAWASNDNLDRSDAQKAAARWFGI